MGSIGEHTDASSSEAELGRIGDDERPSLSEVVVASADTGTRPVPARRQWPSLMRYWNIPAAAGLITTANRLSGTQPGKLRQSNWATAVGYRLAPNVAPHLGEWTPRRVKTGGTL